MTLDEAIKHCEEKAKELRKEADLFSNSPAYSESTTAGCLECAKEHEQLAEWLKELKAYKEASKGDLISREALLKAMEEERQFLLARGQTGAEHIIVHHCLPIIDNAPTVEQRPQGEWIEDGYRDLPCVCSYCGEVGNNTKYCPNCGADMRGEE